MTDHMSVHPEFPPDFAAFQARRQRFFDRLAAETVLREVTRDARPAAGAKEEAMDPGPLTVQGELTVLTAERRLILGYFAPGQRDLADVIHTSMGFEDEAFGVGRVGAVRITIERVPER